MNISEYIDYTIFRPDATREDVIQVIEEAKEKHFATVCVNQYRTRMCVEMLRNTGVKVCTVIGFPLGAVTTEVKVNETICAIKAGSDEIDMVMNIGAFKDGDFDYVRAEIDEIRRVCGPYPLKVIIETCLLSREEIIKACEIVLEAKAKYVKTSTGFSTGGATADEVILMKRTVRDKAKIKASGGINSMEKALEMIDAGAERIGTSTLFV